MHKYLIVIEKSGTGYSAYSPDLPGCIATAEDRLSVETNMREAVQFHLEGLKTEGYPVPDPSAESAYLEVVAG